MKSYHSTLLIFLFAGVFVNAAPKYWVGPLNGNWSSTANWSDVLNGPGGATIPGSLDSVIFFNNASALVHVDLSTIISSLNVRSNVTLYASSPVALRLLKYLFVSEFITLKDSTSADVPFQLVLNGATAASGQIYGDWVFEGGVSLANTSTSGAGFSVEAGAIVTVLSVGNLSAPGFSQPYAGYKGGQVICKRNTGAISSTPGTLNFTYNTNYILDNNLDAQIPSASWSGDQLASPDYSGIFRSPAATIQIKGNIEKLRYSEAILNFGKVVVDLPNLSADFDLSIPTGSWIRGNLEILNTNGHILTLLSASSSNDTVNVTLGNPQNGSGFGGVLLISGNSTKVALARASAAKPATNFHLQMWKDFNQTGGAFSLQDYNSATGSTTLELKNNLVQTGGLFTTNSTSTTARFVIHMTTPPYITGPSGSFNSLRNINMSSGTIDNASHKVILRIDHYVYLINGYETNPNGVRLQSPLQVGRLELIRSPLSTTSTNVLTVNDPSADAITLGGVAGADGAASGINATCYVNGPVRRATNSTQRYFFPTGKGNYYVTSNFNTYINSFSYDSCYVIPISNTPSVYQAEYFKTGYADDNVTAPLLSISRDEYWDFARISGAEAQVRFKFHAPVITAAGSSTLVPAQFENGHWISAKGSTINPCAVTDSFIVSKLLSNFTPFTFGYLTDASTQAVPANLTKGLAYKFYQGTFNALPDFNALTPVITGNSGNVDISVRPAGVNDNFAFKWEGYIKINTPGIYTFETISDDGSKVYFNIPYCASAAAVVNNDGVHGNLSAKGAVDIKAAGTYPFSVTFFENNSGQSMQLFWTGPGISRQAIPDSVFSYYNAANPPASGAGLTYKYYEGSFNVLPDFNTLISIKTGTSPNIDLSVRTAGVNDNFAFLWEGTIKIPVAGTYTFETISDDGSKVYFNGSILVSNDGLHAPTSATGTVTVAAGVYPISVSYFEKDGGETMQMYWSGPGLARQLVPDDAFGSAATPPATGGGLNYKYYEGDFNSLPDFNTLTPVKTGTSANTDIGVRPAGVNDHFAFVWQGAINLPAAGTYTFETISDDGSKVYFNIPYTANGASLVNNDGLHAPNSASGTVIVPAAGSYPITITFFEKDGGETMQLYYTGPGISRQLIPDAAFTSSAPPAGNTGGLNYKYYEGDFNALPDYSTLTPVKTGTSANVDISVRTPGVNDHFAFIWNGTINLPAAGTYTFETISDDGSKVYFNIPYSLNGNSTVSNDGLHAPNSATGTVTVPVAGTYPISITFFEKDGGETMQLYWTGPGIARQLIPDAAFTITNTAGNTAMVLGVQPGNLIVELKDGAAGTKIYPNPFIERFTIDYYNAGNKGKKAVIELFDVNGKLIYNYQAATLLAGYNRWTINLGGKHFVDGVYTAQLMINGMPVKTMKLVKTKR